MNTSLCADSQSVLINTILTPIIRAEINNLLYWIERCPLPCLPKDKSNLHWFISIDQVWHDSHKLRVINAVKKSSLSCINVSFLSCNIDPHQSVYYREKPDCDTSHLELGLKSGPNLQFFNSIKQILNLKEISTIKAVILLETDAFPLRKYWIDLINQSISNEGQFYICGSTPQGLKKVGDSIKYHINGNAIYNISHPAFNFFLNMWENILKKSLSLKFNCAYDICLEYALNIASCWQLLTEDEQSFLLNHYLVCRVTLNKVIVNLSELNVNNVLKLTHLLPEAVVLHDKNFPLLNNNI